MRRKISELEVAGRCACVLRRGASGTLQISVSAPLSESRELHSGLFGGWPQFERRSGRERLSFRHANAPRCHPVVPPAAKSERAVWSFPPRDSLAAPVRSAEDLQH